MLVSYLLDLEPSRSVPIPKDVELFLLLNFPVSFNLIFCLYNCVSMCVCVCLTPAHTSCTLKVTCGDTHQ